MSKFKAVSIDAAFGLMERLVGGTVVLMANALTTYSTVIPRESGESSTPRHLDSITSVTAYWIARSSRAMTPRV
ncbi:hypothetical protein ACVWWO_001818 [Bradyrhizobium sp. F1.13.1]